MGRMKSHELAKKLLALPDVKVKINEQGAPYDWEPTNVYLTEEKNVVMIKNWSHKTAKNQRAWLS